MDLLSLAVVLRAALSPNPDERKAAEQSLIQVQYAPQHLVRLLQITVDGNCDLAVRQAASIHFKNFIRKNWSPEEPGEHQKILESDKSIIRENILGFITQVPSLLRVQIGECLKTITIADYPEQWPSLLHWIKCNLQLQDEQIFGALYALRILSRKYEFKADEERMPVHFIVDETFPHLLSIFDKLVQFPNPSTEVADIIKLICKIFWSSIYLEIPKQLYDPYVFNAWMILFLNILESPVPLEGQPTDDPELRKSWGWWKTKKWIVRIFNRLYTRFGDPKIQNPENIAFAQMFQKNYAGKILECDLHLLSIIRTGGYLPDRVTNLALQYVSNSISENSMYQLLQPHLDILIVEIIFPLMCFNDNDQKLWDEDPHEYIRKGYDIIEDLYSPRTAALDFVGELVKKRGKGNLQKFVQFLEKNLRRYDEASIEFKPYTQKDGALLAIGSLSDKLKQTEPYKSELERMLVQHILPEFKCHVGHIRAKSMGKMYWWDVGLYYWFERWLLIFLYFLIISFRVEFMSISENSMYQLLQPHLDILIVEIIFPLMCFNDNDQKLWDEDPHEYIRKGYDIIEDLYSPRTAALDFVGELVKKRGKGNLQKFVQFLEKNLRRYDEASIEFKPYTQKDGALLAIGSLSDKLKQTEPYKSELERMLVQHILPEFKCHVGHIRAKAAWVAGQYASISFSDPNNFQRALHCVISGLRDPELPVRVDSVFALRPFIEACKDLNEIRPILPQLLDEFFKLMNEVENDDLVFTLETIVSKFGEEMAPYAIGLCQNLAAEFWRCMSTSEADDEADDMCALAAAGCLRTINTILESISRLPHLFVKIEPTLLPILCKMLTIDGQDVFEEIMDIVSFMTLYPPTISLEMWSLWPMIMEALREWAIDYFENILDPLDNYISRGTEHFLMCKDPDYQQSLWNTLSSIMSNKNLEDHDIMPAPKLIVALFQNCKDQVDQWVEPYLRIIIERLHLTVKSHLKCLLIQVIAASFYYNAALSLGVLQKLNVATEFFALWFQMLQQVKKNGARAYFKKEHDKKVCCLGLTSLIVLPENQLPGEALGRVFNEVIELLVSYKDQVAESKKADGKGNNMNGFQMREENGCEDDSDGEMEDEDDDEAFQQDEEDDDSNGDFNDDDIIESPIDIVDPFLFFVETIKVVQASYPARFQNLMQTMDSNHQALANGIAQHAEQRRDEVERKKLEKAANT